MPYDKDGKYFRKPVLKEDSESNKEKLLSERKRGYLIAILFGTFGLPFGWITSPLVLYVLNKKLKEKNGKVPNRFLRWALIGIIGAPLSIAPVFLIPDEALKTSAEKGFVSKEMYGDKWPLTVDSGTLSCVSAENLNDHLWDYKTYFTTGDKTYIIWSEQAIDEVIKGKKNNHQFMSGNLTMDLDGDGRLDKSISFLEIKAKSLCKEFDEDGNTRYKILPVWQRKDRVKQGLPVWVLK